MINSNKTKLSEEKSVLGLKGLNKCYSVLFIEYNSKIYIWISYWENENLLFYGMKRGIYVHILPYIFIYY